MEGTQPTAVEPEEPSRPPEGGGPSRGGSPGGGPTGKEVSPGIVILLTIVTLGIYMLFWGWNRTSEVDAYSAGGTDAHRPFKIGIGLYVGAAVLWAVAFVVTGSATDLSGAGAGFALMGLAGLVGLAGAIAVLVSYWRVWKFVEVQEREIGSMNPLSPGLMLALTLIPIVNYIGIFYVLYRTQKGLNTVWAGGEGVGTTGGQPSSG